MSDFEKCKYADSCVYDLCVPEFCNEYEVARMTNGDRIRAMTDEELAKTAANHVPLHAFPDGVRNIYFSRQISKYRAWLEWIKQPAGGGN